VTGSPISATLSSCDHYIVQTWVGCQLKVNIMLTVIYGWRRIKLYLLDTWLVCHWVFIVVDCRSIVCRVSIVVKSSRCSCSAPVPSLLSGSPSVLYQPFAGSLPTPNSSSLLSGTGLPLSLHMLRSTTVYWLRHVTVLSPWLLSQLMPCDVNTKIILLGTCNGCTTVNNFPRFYATNQNHDIASVSLMP